MKIGVIGAGNIGAAFAKHLGMAGHEIMLSFHKDAAELEATARRFGALPAQAVDFGPLTNARFAAPAMMVIGRLEFGFDRGYRVGLALLAEDAAGAR